MEEKERGLKGKPSGATARGQESEDPTAGQGERRESMRSQLLDAAADALRLFSEWEQVPPGELLGKPGQQTASDKTLPMPAPSIRLKVDLIELLAGAGAVSREKPGKEPEQPPAPTGGVQAAAETLQDCAGSQPIFTLAHAGKWGEAATPVAVVGALRTAQEAEEERWKCKVPSCAGSFHRLKDCAIFGGMDWEDRMRLCLGCLTLGHSRSAKPCPYKEERADVCKRLACKAGHHHLLYLERSQTKKGRKGRPPDKEDVARPNQATMEPTQNGGQGSSVQLVAQLVDTKGGNPAWFSKTPAPR
jgi:hypothetical protein